MTTTAKKTRNNTATRSPAKAGKSFPKALAQQYKTIHKLVVQSDRQDVQNRYEIAVHCLEVRQGDGSEKTYGANAVQKLAEKLGWNKTDIYDYSNVAMAWPDKTKFDELAARTDKFGKPLTWTHFRRLATADVSKRDQLIQDCLDNGWSVRDLKTEMQARTGSAASTGTSDLADPESLPLQGLVAEIQNYGAQVAALKKRAGTLGQRLAAKINEVDPSDCNDASLDQLLAVRLDLKELIDQFDAVCRQLTERYKVPSAVSVAPGVVLSDGANAETLVRSREQTSIQTPGSAGSVT